MSVKLRKIKNLDGTTSLLLDTYHKGKRVREFLQELKLDKPGTAIDRKVNRERLDLAEAIRNKRELQISGDDYDLTPKFKTGVDFMQFFESYLSEYQKKDHRVMMGCYGKFKDFMTEEAITSLTSRQINKDIVVNFKDYLEQTLNGETPANYFKKFKKVIQVGVRKNIFSKNPFDELSREELKIKRSVTIKKEILTFDEIKLLASTTVTNNEVKRAFLFSCLTGLRFCDILTLKWKNVQSGMLNIVQQKTGSPVQINLNQSSLTILGSQGKGEDFVFTLPSHVACLKNLRVWCKKAGIDKKITWHCARHSFATWIIYYGSDVKSASSLLGHNSLAYTDRYVRIVDKLKEKAVENLPEVNLI